MPVATCVVVRPLGAAETVEVVGLVAAVFIAVGINSRSSSDSKALLVRKQQRKLL